MIEHAPRQGGFVDCGLRVGNRHDAVGDGVDRSDREAQERERLASSLLDPRGLEVAGQLIQ